MNIVINGYYELEVYLSKENMKHHSGAIDTGMIDGVSGISKKWNSYWRACGVCHLHFKPEYILHMEHFKEDIKVIDILRSMFMERQTINLSTELVNLNCHILLYIGDCRCLDGSTKFVGRATRKYQIILRGGTRG